MTRVLLALALLLGPVWAGADVVCSTAQTTCGGGGTSTGGDNTWTGTQTFLDSKFWLADDVDPTKKAAFQLSGLSPGQPRTYTLPNWSSTLASLDQPQLFTQVQRFGSTMTLDQGAYIAADYGAIFGNSGSFGTVGTISTSGSQVPAAPMLLTGTVSNSWIISPSANRFFAHGHALATHPTLFIHSANQSTTQWMGLSHDGTAATFSSGTQNYAFSAATGLPTVYWGGYSSIALSSIASRTPFRISAEFGDAGYGLQFEAGASAAGTSPRHYIPTIPATLTDATATRFGMVRLPSNSVSGGTLFYTLMATSGGSFQVRAGSIPFTVMNVAGTRTCTFGTPSETTQGSGTLTLSFDCENADVRGYPDGVLLRANADSSLNVSPVFHWQGTINGAQTLLSDWF